MWEKELEFFFPKLCGLINSYSCFLRANLEDCDLIHFFMCLVHSYIQPHIIFSLETVLSRGEVRLSEMYAHFQTAVPCNSGEATQDCLMSAGNTAVCQLMVYTFLLLFCFWTTESKWKMHPFLWTEDSSKGEPDSEYASNWQHAQLDINQNRIHFIMT